MLRKRLITTLTINNGILFRTKLFEPDYRYTMNFIDTWSVDEIITLDITRGPNRNRQQFLKTITGLAKNCFVPLSCGGGVRSLDDARCLFVAGADKIILNTGAIEKPELITEIARVFGTQAIILSIDTKEVSKGDYRVFSNSGQRLHDLIPWDWAKQGEELGAGEVLITAIDRDGSLEGYDLDLTRRVADTVNIPVLALGGAGSWQHFIEGFEIGKASAVCSQNIYHFTEQSIQNAKIYLADKGINVRI